MYIYIYIYYIDTYICITIYIYAYTYIYIVWQYIIYIYYIHKWHLLDPWAVFTAPFPFHRTAWLPLGLRDSHDGWWSISCWIRFRVAVEVDHVEVQGAWCFLPLTLLQTQVHKPTRLTIYPAGRWSYSSVPEKTMKRFQLEFSAPTISHPHNPHISSRPQWMIGSPAPPIQNLEPHWTVT